MFCYSNLQKQSKLQTTNYKLQTTNYRVQCTYLLFEISGELKASITSKKHYIFTTYKMSKKKTFYKQSKTLMNSYLIYLHKIFFKYINSTESLQTIQYYNNYYVSELD